MTAVASPFDLPKDDETELITLLDEIDALRQTLPHPTAPIRRFDGNRNPCRLSQFEIEILAKEQRVLEIVDGYFRSCLPGIMMKLFGPGVISQRKDTAVRFTEMINNFFVKLLEKRPDAFWRARTAKNLRLWASVANANLMRDVLRREKRGREILQDIAPLLAPLVAERNRHFEKTVGIPLGARVLEQLETWLETGDSTHQEMALVMRYRYLDGMPYPEIAHMLGVFEGTVQSRRTAAIEWLRDNLR
ncbi:MAG: sigma-70 family RNA polymerase sigma factor [Planctomycetota bacterium]|nr:sigma-70 family RNA polymerase sigma factor [Planctomycetota bacterium]